MTASLLANPRVPEPRPSTDDGQRTGANAPGSSAFDELETMVDRLLREQSELTAVQRFSQLVDASSEPLQARYYRALLPAASPGPGEQYAFEVDLDRCSGCKACVTACHNLNGLDDDETWRDVGLLHGRSGFKTACRTEPRGPLTKFSRRQPGFEAASTTPAHPAVDGAAITAATPLLQHVTTACHHCVEPGCLAACPTIAYEKDVATGIVKHLDDQCFGCQYCTLACPYGVPKYHAGKGIVRKCDLCSNRLRAGEAPACVQACPHEAIRVNVVSQQAARELAARDHFLPASPSPRHTIPTTVYKSARLDLSAAGAADEGALEPDHAHPPLVMMLVLTQFAVGLFAVDAVLCLAGTGVDGRGLGLRGRLVAFGIANLGLACATLHLGRPWLAFRAVLGWRTSWLSREALVFGVFVKLTVLQLAVETWLPSWSNPGLGLATAWAGLAGVWCSVMIYAVCPRPLWNLSATTARFGATTLGLGCAGTNALFAMLPEAPDRIAGGTSSALSICLLTGGTLLAWRLVDDFLLAHAPASAPAWRLRARKLRTGPLARVGTARVVLCLAGYFTLAAGCLLAETGASSLGMVLAAVGLATRIGGELCERWMFFAGSTTPRMPGGVTA